LSHSFKVSIEQVRYLEDACARGTLQHPIGIAPCDQEFVASTTERGSSWLEPCASGSLQHPFTPEQDHADFLWPHIQRKQRIPTSIFEELTDPAPEDNE
jgi:hypothetical protein